MPQTTSRSFGLGRRGLIAGATGLASGLAMPVIAQNKPIRLGWIAAVSGMFASNAQAQDWGFRMAVQTSTTKGGCSAGSWRSSCATAPPIRPRPSARQGAGVQREHRRALRPDQQRRGAADPRYRSGAKKLHLIGGSVEELIDPVKYPFGFRNLNTNGQWIKVAVKFMVEDLKKTKIAIINDNTGYGVLSRDKVTQFLAARNLKPVYTATVDPNKPDVTDELLKARKPAQTSSPSGRTPPVSLRAW